MTKSFLRVILIGLLSVPGVAYQQTPRPPRAKKDCNCEAKFKACKQYAKNKAAKKACEEDQRSCLAECKGGQS